MARKRWRAAAAAILVTSALALGCGDETDTSAAGVPCGEGTCGETQYCCHPECALCVEQGVSCPQDCN